MLRSISSTAPAASRPHLLYKALLNGEPEDSEKVIALANLVPISEKSLFALWLVRHRPSADPPWMKLLALRRLRYFSAAVGKEVGFSMARKSP